ncbi:hypothetical protein CHAB381_0082 [Campylobacter hominis ATCC BAA-381]|uniref:Uncharacterized protein n=1 Tax=Campylobacter hominis (strain ATCC BAA-381 / DSM 21671 / CCUG 45161 / LMG 19568 / NCTC 13146 / CH001A) TaxID=360107 RepID=A7HZK4_CAMHC|nr:hypothetical protein CHAB381_0082 [Campylobacter hominis ATCC BAA-381]
MHLFSFKKELVANVRPFIKIKDCNYIKTVFLCQEICENFTLYFLFIRKYLNF